jgi:predicted DNA-binding transcriptional regulator AlpA
MLGDCSAMHVWRLLHDERHQHLTFPRPAKINGRLYWRAADIERWIRRQVEAAGR